MTAELTLTEAARVLGVTPATLRQQQARGKIQATKRGGVWFLSHTQVRAYAKRSRRDNAGRWGSDGKWLVPPAWHEHEWHLSGSCFDDRCAERD